MTISNEVRRLEEENEQLKRALAQILDAIKSAVPLIQSVIAQPEPPKEQTVQMTSEPPQQTTVPPTQQTGDGAYRVDVSGMIPNQQYQTREY